MTYLSGGGGLFKRRSLLRNHYLSGIVSGFWFCLFYGISHIMGHFHELHISSFLRWRSLTEARNFVQMWWFSIWRFFYTTLSRARIRLTFSCPYLPPPLDNRCELSTLVKLEEWCVVFMLNSPPCKILLDMFDQILVSIRIFERKPYGHRIWWHWLAFPPASRTTEGVHTVCLPPLTEVSWCCTVQYSHSQMWSPAVVAASPWHTVSTLRYSHLKTSSYCHKLSLHELACWGHHQGYLPGDSDGYGVIKDSLEVADCKIRRVSNVKSPL